MNKRLIRLGRGVALGLAILTIPAMAYAETNAAWCAAQGGTWKGPDETHGICACVMVGNAHNKQICDSVGGQTISHGGVSQCAVPGEQIARAKRSSEFHGALTSTSRVIQHREDMP